MAKTKEAQVKSRKRMREIVESLQKYMETYHTQYGYQDYSDETFIDDVLYGLGRSLGKQYEFAVGFDKFKKDLLKHLQKSPAESRRPIGPARG